jgi:hypothetical protein
VSIRSTSWRGALLSVVCVAGFATLTVQAVALPDTPSRPLAELQAELGRTLTQARDAAATAATARQSGNAVAAAYRAKEARHRVDEARELADAIQAHSDATREQRAAAAASGRTAQLLGLRADLDLALTWEQDEARAAARARQAGDVVRADHAAREVGHWADLARRLADQIQAHPDATPEQEAAAVAAAGAARLHRLRTELDQAQARAHDAAEQSARWRQLGSNSWQRVMAAAAQRWADEARELAAAIQAHPDVTPEERVAAAAAAAAARKAQRAAATAVGDKPDEHTPEGTPAAAPAAPDGDDTLPPEPPSSSSGGAPKASLARSAPSTADAPLQGAGRLGGGTDILATPRDPRELPGGQPHPAADPGSASGSAGTERAPGAPVEQPRLPMGATGAPGSLPPATQQGLPLPGPPADGAASSQQPPAQQEGSAVASEPITRTLGAPEPYPAPGPQVSLLDGSDGSVVPPTASTPGRVETGLSAIGGGITLFGLGNEQPVAPITASATTVGQIAGSLNELLEAPGRPAGLGNPGVGGPGAVAQLDGLAGGTPVMPLHLPQW